MIELTPRASAAASKTGVEPIMILDIEGCCDIFTSGDLYGAAKIGDEGLLVGDDWKIGGVGKLPNAKTYISMESGATTKQLTQQLQQSEGGSGSIGAISLELVDREGELTKLISDNLHDDLLGRNATIYLAFKGTAFPDDAVRQLSGVISDLKAKAGSWVFKIQHAEAKKKTTLFVPGQATLLQAVGAADTTIYVDNIENFPNSISSEGYSAYCRIDDEFIKYDRAVEMQEGVFSLLNCQRGQVPPDKAHIATGAVAHELDSDVTTAVRIEGRALDIALKLMLSSETWGTEDLAIKNIGQVDPRKRVQNALLFSYDIKDLYGLTVGDRASLTYIIEGGYLAIDCKIVSFGESSFGYYVVVDGDPLPHEVNVQHLVSFGSKYNSYEEGCGMTSLQVDVEQHEKYQALYGNAFPNYDFFLEEEIEAQELINKQCYFPMGAFQLPKKGRVSIGLTKPPISEGETVLLSTNNITNPHKLEITRSVNENFCTAVDYRYSYDSENDKYLGRTWCVSTAAKNIKRDGEKIITIKSLGLRKNQVDKAFVRTMGQRLIDRYAKAAEAIKGIELNLKTGFQIEIGDTVLFGDPELNMADLKNGTRSFEPRLMEIQNKQTNLKTGRVTIELLDTSFESNGRYGTISPSSLCGMGSTNSEIRVLSSGATLEQERWFAYLNEEIIVYSYDYSESQMTTLKGLSPDTPNTLLVSPALSFIPTKGEATSGHRISLAPYSDNPKKNKLSKGLHVYLNPSVQITEGINGASFKVDPLDADKFLEGATIKVVNYGYSVNTEEVKVVSVVGDTINCQDLGVTPDATMKVELIGFKDGGKPYRWL